MENHNHAGRQDQGYHDDQQQEAYSNSNLDENPHSTPNENNDNSIEYTDHENKRLDTDPNRYANFNGGDRTADDQFAAARYDDDDVQDDSAAIKDDPSRYSSEDDRQVNNQRDQNESHHTFGQSKTASEEDTDHKQFFDGL